MPEIPLGLYYPLFTATMLIMVVLFVPKEKYQPLFWVSLFWGFFVCHLFILIFGAAFNLFRWIHAEPFVFLHDPLFIKLAWLLAMMLYFYFLPQNKEKYVLSLYIFMFSFISAALDRVFNQVGILTYIHWNPFYRFLGALIWFYLATIHYRSLE